VTVTPCVQGHIEWRWLKATHHRERIIAEINARDATVLSTVGMQWNKLRQTMAKLDGATDNKSTPSFRPQTEWFQSNQSGLIDAFNASNIGRTK
jgi:hypothetical protein